MSSSSPSAAHLRRLVALLSALVLLPLSIVLSAGSAQAAAAFHAEGSVYDALSDPLSGVTVDALAAPGYSTVAATATTNAEGGYTLVLPNTAGTYHLRYSKANYTTAFLGGGTGANVTVNASGDISVDGEPAEDNVLEDMALAATAKHPVPGTVQASGGANLSGITVNAYFNGDEDGDVQATATTTNGAYTLQLPAGEYVVQAVDNDTVVDPQTYDAAWLTPDASPTHSVVRVAADGTFKVDDTTKTSLPTITMTPSSVNTPHPVSGTVEDANGDPVAGVTVTPSVGPSTGTATTTSAGVYTLQLKPGTYQLDYHKTGFTDATYPASITVALNGTVTPSSPLDAVTLADAVGDATISGRVVSSATGNPGLGGITVDVFPTGDFTPASRIATTTTATTGTVGAWSVNTLKIGTYDIRFSGTSGGSTYDATYYGGTTVETTTPVKVGQGNVITVAETTKSSGALGTTSMTQSSADTPHPVSGTVVDANSDPIDGVTVTATATATVGPSTGTATSASDGVYTLQLKPGTYTLGYHKTGFTDATYSTTVTVAIDGTVTPSNPLDAVTLDDATGDATISGRVVSSATGNPGLGGITVDVFPAGDFTPASRVATTTTATTGTVGAWSVSTLKIGTYDIRFSGTSGGSTYDATYYGGTTPDATTPVQVNQGNVITVNEITKPSGALGTTSMTQSSADTPHPVSGTVEDANGDPIDGVTVTATSSAAPVTATTTSAGLYTLQLKPGTYQLGYHKTGFNDTTYSTTVTVAIDGTVTPSSTLDSVTLDDATGDATISGRVVSSATGNPGLGGITVDVFPTGDFTPASRIATTTTATTGTVGAWSVNTLKIGTYDIRFSGTSGGSTYDATYYGGTTPDATTPVQVNQGNVITVSEATKLNGALGTTSMTQSSADTPHPVSGEVDDANGDPIDGVTVTATSSAAPVTATTASGGLYTLQLKPGTYTLGYHKSGFTDATYSTTVTVAIDGTVTPSSPLDAVTLADAVGDATISGRVVSSAAGNPGLNGITVDVFPAGDFTGTPIATATTSTVGGIAGSWSVATLKIDTYDIRFSGTSGGTSYDTTYYGGTTPTSTTPVQVGQGNVVTVGGFTKVSGALGTTSMTQSSNDTAHPVSGEADDANGDPIAGVTVTPSGGQAATAATTASDGTYTLMLKPGTYTLTFAKSGFTSTTFPGSGEPTQTVTVALNGTVTPASPLDAVTLDDANGDATISGRVVSSAAGNPGLGGITVDVFPAGDFTPASRVATTTTATTGTVGSWSVSTLKIGTYDIRFSGTSGGTTYDTTYYGGTTTTTPVQVGQGNVITVNETTKLDGALGNTAMAAASASSTYVVVGDVTDANGDPINNVTVTATKQASGTNATATPDAEGHYALTLAVGTYKVKFTAAGFQPTDYSVDGDTAATIEVKVGGAVLIDTEPADGADLGSASMLGTTPYSLSGTVVSSAGGAGLTGIKVEARVSGDTVVVGSTTTGAGGAFTLSLPINTYQISFSGTATDGQTYPITYFGGSSAAEVKVAFDGKYYFNDEVLASFGSVSLTPNTSDTRFDLAGTVSGLPPDFEPLDGVTVTAVPVSGTAAGSGDSTVTGADPKDGELGDAGVYRLHVKAGRYTLQFSKSGYQSTFLPDANDANKPAIVTVSNLGALSATDYDFSQGYIDDVSMKSPAAVFSTKPKLTGKVVPGQTVTASFGKLQGVSFSNDAVTVEWFVDGKLDEDHTAGGLGQKFAVPASAATKKLSYRITIDPSFDDEDYTGAPSVFTSTPVTVAKAPAKVKGVFKKGKLTVTLSVPTLSKPLGTIIVKDGKKKVATIKLKAKNKGKVVLKLKLKPGKHKLTLSYAGSKTVSAAKATVKVTIKK
ncbi:carboxypeptidase-like regulatory domain-containing protein [Nocardioides conyzicola]|uniref:Alpha-amylase n=1 Tax=Nocardioides conyzicola TaxID=1651781 RepID=A0ABP8X6Z3_9ACTN